MAETTDTGLRVATIEHGNVGPLTDKLGWTQVTVRFRDEITSATPKIEFYVPIAYQPDWTVEQVYAAAQERMFDMAQALVSGRVQPTR